ncbi:MAG: peptidoglycan DD-metalloendopeptidase family protein [Candidatus Lernaella stagnicola]|nr:peptidoglycan DD-metalloendopeptidase family protein [Candidatus Lernaella stagnicola]
MRRFFRLAVILLVALMAAAEAFAADPEVERRLAAETAKMRAAMSAERSLLRQLYAIDHLRYQHEKNLAKIGSGLEEVRRQMAGDAAQIERLQTQMPIRAARLGRRLAALYRMGRGGFWKVLLTSDSFRTFLRRYRALQQIVEMDAEALATHRTQLLAIRRKRRDLERRRAHLMVLREQENQAAVNIEVEKRKKMYLLTEIRRDKALAARLSRDLVRQDAALGQTVAAIPDQTPVPRADRPLRLDFAQHRGYLPSPVHGPIVGYFGRRMHEQFGTETRSNGIDIAAPTGTPVRAVADGMVRYIGEFLGYGRVLIVDHGQRFHSLYAHLGSFARARGDTVYQGEVVGTIGSSSLLGRSVLHFEIRRKGVAVDPLLWLRATP